MMTLIEIDIRAVHESTHNPRRHFDEAQLTQLAENIAQVGILTPLLVRPAPHSTPKTPQYEIAAGHRRYRAAKLAKLTLLPCLVREMRDQEFMEVLNIENLQRQGLHPLDEAKGYEALMAAPYSMDVQTIADKVGRSAKYLYDRVKLLALTEEAQALFWDGKILAGHAILLARLSPADQERAIDRGLLQDENALFDDRVKDGKYDGLKAVSVRELEHWIDKNVRFDAFKAAPLLFPETVQAVQAAIEDEDKIILITHDHYVTPDAKVEGIRTYGPMSWKRADGKEPSKTCDHAVLGVVVVGGGRGEAFKVCIEKKKCLIHWKAEVKAADARAKGEPSTPRAKAASDKEQTARKKEEETRERARERKKHWEKLSPKIEAVVMERVKALPVTGVLGDLIVNALQGHHHRKTTVSRGKTADDLLRHLGALVLHDAIHEWNAVEAFPALAKRIGVDLSPFVKLESKGKKGTSI